LWAVEIHRLGLEIIGLWPTDDKFDTNNLWLKLRIGIILILLIFVINVPTIHGIFQVWGNMVLVIDNFRSALTLLMSLMKYVVMLWKRTGISKIIYSKMFHIV
jgi:hypothetical protein